VIAESAFAYLPEHASRRCADQRSHCDAEEAQLEDVVRGQKQREVATKDEKRHIEQYRERKTDPENAVANLKRYAAALLLLAPAAWMRRIETGVRHGG
jgi:hypothetical protein